MRTRMAVAVITVAGALAVYTTPARAIGCISGGLAGAVAGHMMHHGVLGAIGGCVAGHEYHKHETEAAQQRSSNNGYSNNGDEQHPVNRSND